MKFSGWFVLVRPQNLTVHTSQRVSRTLNPQNDFRARIRRRVNGEATPVGSPSVSPLVRTLSFHGDIRFREMSDDADMSTDNYQNGMLYVMGGSPDSTFG